GPAVSKTLRHAVTRAKGVRKAGDLMIVDLVRTGSGDSGEVAGAVALHLATGAPVTIAAKATIVAAGGLTRLYRRNSASANMGGDGYALALRAGAPLIDMEFVQFFPIGHLAPRLIGMDPIMWDPFRYKLGGRLLNSQKEEFTARYGTREDGPIAHYNMGEVAADPRMETEVPGLLVAGEAVGGANGANRLSGNAITEVLAFGRRGGRSAAERAKGRRHAFDSPDARDAVAL